MPSGLKEEVPPGEELLRASPKPSPPPTTVKSEGHMGDEHDTGNPTMGPGGAPNGATEESVEVVLGGEGESTGTKVVDSPDRNQPSQDQSIFRHPQPVHPAAMHAPNGAHHHHPHQSYLHASGSYGYRHGDYPHPSQMPRPYPVPPQNASGSFDDQGSYPHPTPHYSPHGQYPPPRYSSEDVNVISPNHKGDPHYRPPVTPRARPSPSSQSYYQYPPTSPVSRPGGTSSAPPRLRNYAMRRGETAYARAQRDAYNREDGGAWGVGAGGGGGGGGGYPPHPPPPQPRGRAADPGRRYPPVVAESFDSEHYNRGVNAPHVPPPPPPSSQDAHYQSFYNGGGSFGSFDSAGPPAPPQFDDHRYYGFSPDSPYSAYGSVPPYSPGGIYRTDSFPGTPAGPYAQHGAPSFTYGSYDENDRFMHGEYGPMDGDDPLKSPKGKGRKGAPPASNTGSRGMVLPKAAEEVDFEVTNPPPEPVTQPSEKPVCESMADVNNYDVLCGRGGGTNSQVGNRRFRKLVQEFQPTYLMAKRKEKPLLARTIVLVIRKRGGRFLKKNEDTGELFEVGDTKAEAKTSQALREGLDVRATRSAANNLSDKKKKKKSSKSSSSSTTSPKRGDELSPAGTAASSGAVESCTTTTPKGGDGGGGSNNGGGSGSGADGGADVVASTDRRPVAESPPNLPQLAGEEAKPDVKDPAKLSPHQMHFRKRRRMRSTDQFFPDFCPPRADLARPGSPSLADEEDDDGIVEMASTPIRRNNSKHQDDNNSMPQYEEESVPPRGCAGIALDLVTGAATGSFCLGPTGWRR